MHPLTRFVFLGAPGVGKGSFSAIIAPQLGLAAVGVGDLIRNEVKRRTDLGSKLEVAHTQVDVLQLARARQALSDSGQLAPDEVINRLVEGRLSQPDAEKGFILDGFPRSLSQAQWLDATGINLDRVINITVPEWVAITKLLGRRHCPECRRGFNVVEIIQDGFDMPKILPDFHSCHRGGRCPRSLDKLEMRKDDTEDIIRRRLAVHRSETAPLLDFYKAKGLLRNFQVRRGLSDKDSLVDLMLRE